MRVRIAYAGAFGAFAGLVLTAAVAQAEVVIPGCEALGPWALKLDSRDFWQPNAIGSRTQIPRLFAEEEATALFKAPMVAWTEADAQAIRQAVLACRRATKDKAQSGAYNAMQSALSSRVANYVKALPQARADMAAAMQALAAQPPSLPLLRFHAALAQAATREGYGQAQRVAAALPGAAAAGRDLLAAIRELPEAEIAANVSGPAARAAETMRAGVVEGLLADVGKLPASGDGLATLKRMAELLPREYGDALGEVQLKAVQQAVAERRDAVAREIAAQLVQQIGESSEGMDAFDDIDRRADEGFLPNLPAAEAALVREAAAARRQAVGEPLLGQIEAKLAGLPATDAGLREIDQALAGFDAWPASAGAFKARARQAAAARRDVVLAAVTKAEAGPLRGRVYESEGGGFKLEFVDRTRVFATVGGSTVAGTYTEEADGRVVVSLGGQAPVFRREGRQLVGGDGALNRVK